MKNYWQNLIEAIENSVKKFINSKKKFPEEIEIKITDTSQEHIGDLTLLLFPICKKLNLDLFSFSEEITEYLKKNLDFIKEINVIKGFLNITLSDFCLIQSLKDFTLDFIAEEKKKILIEYCSPNTNKPLHLGHLRNIFLGQSIINIMKIAGNEAISTCVVNDRGVHICKSMAAYMINGEGESPESTGEKGDFFVGRYYVLFDKIFKEEKNKFLKEGFSEKESEEKSEIMQLARELLRKWENNDEKTMTIWKKMNGWVYSGFSETYQKLDVVFDKIYYESETYNLGKNIIEEGLREKIFIKKENGAIAIDLEEEKLGEKIVLREDGTSVYITQDLGMADLRNEEWQADNHVYVVGNEQDYHFKVLFTILEKLGKKYAKNMHHLSYGMVELPTGKMKSREGNVIDADDLLETTFHLVKGNSEKNVKKSHTDKENNDDLYKKISLGAIRYQMLKVDPTKKIVFNPEESIDINGNTAAFIQYTNARIQSLLRKSNTNDDEIYKNDFEKIFLNSDEKDVIMAIKSFKNAVNMAITTLRPNEIANYLYILCKEYSKFYSKNTILSSCSHSETLSYEEGKEDFRLYLSYITSKCIVLGLSALSIEAPEKM